MGMDTEHIFELFSRYSYWVVFLGLFLENAAFLGFVFPGVTILFIAGFLIHSGTVDPFLVLVCAFAGTVLGDNVNYALGRWGLQRLPWVKKMLDSNPKAIEFINKQPVWLYTFFHFPGILRPIVPVGLGASLFSFRLWIIIDFVGALLFVAAYLTGGYVTASLSMDLSGGQSAMGYVTVFFTILVVIWGISMLIKFKPWKKKSND